jgi:beta-glucosidase
VDWQRILRRCGGLTLALVLLLGNPVPLLAADRSDTEVHPQAWLAMPRAIAEDRQVEKFVQQLLGTMTLEEKVGQLIQADIDSIQPADLAQYPLGSILAGGGGAPGGNLHATGAQWLELTDALFRASTRGNSSKHPPIPIVFGIDAVHGHAKVQGATIFPHNVGLGAAHDPSLVEKIGRATAEEVAATGIDWTFAPTVAVVRDVRWGRSYESYSEDPSLVASYARAMATGLQGKLGTADFLTPPTHTLASAKHFLGDGGTVRGRDQFDNLADEHTLREVHAAGYQAAISAGDLIIMASYNGWHGIKMHADHGLLTDVLKGRWHFQGFVVGDWNAQEEIPGCTKFSCPEFLNAGGDMYMAPDSWKQLYANVLKQVASGQIPQARIDDAVRRVLRVKVLAGVFQKPPPKERWPDGLTSIGSAAHRQIARQAVRESLVLLKNNHHTLPLDAHSRILVTGPGADDIGMQSGGWTVDWQGDHNTNADFPGATSILQAIKAAVAAAGGAVVTQIDAGQKPAAAIVVYGETPYAEFEGDRETLEFSQADSPDVQSLRRLREANIPIVSLFISGRPLWVNRELNLSDAFVALWLPGSEGTGVADMLFKPLPGKPRYDFTGRLSFSWPGTGLPVSFDSDNTVHGALFPRGFGLTLAHSKELGQLSEDPKIPSAARVKDTLFHAGHVTAPWSIYVSDPTAQVRLTMQSQTSPDAAVTAQLDSRAVQARWSGRDEGEFRIGGRAVSLPLTGQALRLHYRVEEKPQRAVILSMRCEAAPGVANSDPAMNIEHCGMARGQGVDLTESFRSANVGSWKTLTVPLACLSSAKSPSLLVSAPVDLESSGHFAVSFDEVRLVPDATSSCPALTH